MCTVSKAVPKQYLELKYNAHLEPNASLIADQFLEINESEKRKIYEIKLCKLLLSRAELSIGPGGIANGLSLLLLK